LQLLQLDTVSKRFGSLAVVSGLSIELAEGEALGIIGPNGAGKTTTFNLITGTLRPDAGRVVFAGRDITGARMHHRCRAGIARSYQIPHPFSGMSVFENVLVGATFGAGRRESECYQECGELLRRVGLLAKSAALAGSLTLLERKQLEMARALATRPRLLLLDEIAGGLTEHEVSALIETIREIHAAGTAIIWIEHVVHALLSVVSRLVVLNFGEKLAEGDPQAVMKDPDVLQVYMGIAAE